MADNENKIIHYFPNRHSQPEDSGSDLPERESVSVAQRPSDGESNDTPEVRVVFLPVDRIFLSKRPLRDVQDHELGELVASVKERGILQPLLVRPVPDIPGQFELIAGERRLRAARLAELPTVPALVTNVDDGDALELSIIENAQREDLDAIEEALAYHRLVTEFGMNHTEVAQAIGKNRSTVSNALRLLQLPPEIMQLVKTGELSAGHARVLVSIEDPRRQLSLARQVIDRGMSVRTLEDIARGGVDSESAEDLSEDEEREQKALERMKEKLRESIGVERLSLRKDEQGRRTISIRFDTEASWKRFVGRLKN